MTTMKFKKQERLTRIEAANRLTEIAQALRNSAKLEMDHGEEELELELDIPQDVTLEFEVEIGQAETELEVEITWASGVALAAPTGSDRSHRSAQSS